MSLLAPNTPAVPQQDGGLGNVIKGAVNSALQEARADLQARLADLQAQRAGLEAQLQASGSRAESQRLQSRIDRLDVQITEMNDAMAKLENGVGRTTVKTSPQIPSVGFPPNFPVGPQPRIDVTEIVATSLGILFIAFPLTLAIVRFIWKRSTSAPPAAITQEQARRFDRLEQSVDAIAIEVERISESQRYLTKVLGESKQPSKVEAGSRG